MLRAQVRERHVDVAATYSAATAWGKDLVVAKVDEAEVLAINAKGKARSLFKAEQPIVSALLAHGPYLYIAAGPRAKIYRLDRKGKVEVFFEPDAGFVWDMVLGPKGLLHAALGDPGSVLRIDRKGKGKVLFSPEQEHLRSIAYDREMGLLVGGGERGIVYRWGPGDKEDEFGALFDSGHTEITSLLVHRGAVYAAAVTGAAALASEQGNEQHGGQASKVDVRSQLVEIRADGTSEVLAGSDDEAIFDLAIDDKGAVLIATGATGRSDPRGRLYGIVPEKRHISMVYQSPSRRITHLIEGSKGEIIAVAAAGGRVTQLDTGFAKEGEFLTVPFDALIHSKFGLLQMFGVVPKGTSVVASVRTGQTAKPDNTWSNWSPEVKFPGNQAPRVRNGRYMQLRLLLRGKGKLSPSIHRIRLAYLRQNLRPFVREVVTLGKGVALLPLFRDEQKNKTINLNDKGGDVGAKRNRHKPRARQVHERGALTVRWMAEDPNGDQLRYDLMVRGSGQTGWRTLEKELVHPFYTIHSSQLPDGHYQFRVKATDAPSNPDGFERSDTRESRSVLIDNTPPTIDPLKVRVEGRKVVIRSVVADAVGPLMGAAYAVDGDTFRPLGPDDGVLDGPGESFTIRLGPLDSGNHSVTVRVVDEGGNEGFGEAIFTIP